MCTNDQHIKFQKEAPTRLQANEEMKKALREQNTMGFVKTILYYGGLNIIIITTKFFTSIHNTVSMFYHNDVFYSCDFIN